MNINHNITPANSIFMKAYSKTSLDKAREKVEVQKQQALNKIHRYVATCSEKNEEFCESEEIDCEISESSNTEKDPLYQLTVKQRDYVMKLREKAVFTSTMILDAKNQDLQRRQNAKADAERQKQKENCDKIYASMNRGDKVPLKDRQFLMKTAPALYSMAMLSAMLKEKEGKEVDSVLTKEEKNTPEEEAAFQAEYDELYADENGDGYLDYTHNLDYIMQLNDILDGKLPYSSLKEGTTKSTQNPVVSTTKQSTSSIITASTGGVSMGIGE